MKWQEERVATSCFFFISLPRTVFFKVFQCGSFGSGIQTPVTCSGGTFQCRLVVSLSLYPVTQCWLEYSWYGNSVLFGGAISGDSAVACGTTRFLCLGVGHMWLLNFLFTSWVIRITFYACKRNDMGQTWLNYGHLIWMVCGTRIKERKCQSFVLLRGQKVKRYSTVKDKKKKCKDNFGRKDSVLKNKEKKVKHVCFLSL